MTRRRVFVKDKNVSEPLDGNHELNELTKLVDITTCIQCVNFQLPLHSRAIKQHLSDKNLGQKSINKRIQREVGESYMSSETAIHMLPHLLVELEKWSRIM